MSKIKLATLKSEILLLPAAQREACDELILHLRAVIGCAGDPVGPMALAVVVEELVGEQAPPCSGHPNCTNNMWIMSGLNAACPQCEADVEFVRRKEQWGRVEGGFWLSPNIDTDQRTRLLHEIHTRNHRRA